jgi:prevent-host-death family protein
MKHNLKADTDIKPVSDFRANAAEMIEQVRSTGRPLVLTQRGRSAAVVMDVVAFEAMREEIEILRDIRISMKQIDEGKGISNREAKAELLRRFAR